MYELCAPVLYSDCTPYDFTAFAAGLRTNEHIDRTARLHIHHKRHWTEPTYKDILTVGWDELEDKPILDTVPPSLDLQSVMEECQALIQEGARLRRFITEGLTILPNLRSVSMGGIGDQVFNQTGSIMIERIYSSRFEVTSKILPHALIDLPTLHHYCQAVSDGPLALPGKIIKAKAPIQIFTHHPRGVYSFSSCSQHGVVSPPIILGAINRYYTEKAVLIPYFANGDPRIRVRSVLEPVLAMFNQRDVFVADPTTGTPKVYYGDDDAFDGTIIEIYGYLRTLDRSKLVSSLRAPLNPNDNMHGMPPQTLAVFQVRSCGILDQVEM
jgi:hypothetical protein